eukprot:TRINITY_DN26253_c0_g1_i1.p1 TRINITY_DN26253_c0_g1~~TRINITY_DN26253_c0_g1_i1.p1  ORF type:complete len:291 (+),score=64.76 TRINITY_DN26253_c0_g1_i1:90-962(+)
MVENARLPIVGEPVALSMAAQRDDGLHGPFFDPQVQQMYKLNGKWSDGFMDIFTDCDTFWHCALSCCCPCVVTYQTLERVGAVDLPGNVTLDAMKYIFIFTVVMLVAAWMPDFFWIIPNSEPPKRSDFGLGPADMRLEREGGAMRSGSSADAAWRLLAATTRAPSALDQGSGGVSLGQVLNDLLFWALVFLTMRGVRNKLRVRESDQTSCLKSVCLPPCFCFYGLFIAQAARHVNRQQGFWITAANYAHVHGGAALQAPGAGGSGAVPSPSAPPAQAQELEAPVTGEVVE